MTSSFEQPLLDKQILVTGIRDHSLSHFVQHLTGFGADVESIPLIEVTFLTIDPDDVNAFGPDWIFFTSKNAIHAFYQGMEKALPSTHEPSPPNEENRVSSGYSSEAKIAVIGPSTAQVLKSYGKKADFVSPKANARAAAETFLEMLSLNPAQKQTPLILWPCGNRAYPDLALSLLSAGCTLYPLVAYDTMAPTLSEPETQKIQTNAWNFIVFASASAVQAYVALCTEEKPETIYACLGSKTRQAVIDAGLNNRCIQGTESHYDSLLEALLNFQ